MRAVAAIPPVIGSLHGREYTCLPQRGLGIVEGFARDDDEKEGGRGRDALFPWPWYLASEPWLRAFAKNRAAFHDFTTNLAHPNATPLGKLNQVCRGYRPVYSFGGVEPISTNSVISSKTF